MKTIENEKTEGRTKMVTNYEKEMQSIKRNKLIALIMEVLSILCLGFFIVTVLLYAYDSGVSNTDPEYKKVKACIFKSNCK